MIEFVETDPAKLAFMQAITTMMREDTKTPTYQNITFTPIELSVFLNHLWEYLKEAKPIDLTKLTYALIHTKRRYISMQDQAAAIKDLL